MYSDLVSLYYSIPTHLIGKLSREYYSLLPDLSDIDADEKGCQVVRQEDHDPERRKIILVATYHLLEVDRGV